MGEMSLGGEGSQRITKIAVLTSGGDAPGMNAAVRAVVRKGIYEGLDVWGISHGFAGLLRGELRRLHRSSVADIIHRGGTILHTARCEEFKTPEGLDEAVATLEREGIQGLIVIGGDGSFRGARELHRLGFKVVGVPATIDNDIAQTDYSIGFDTAVNTVVEAINRVRDTATAHERTFVIETMGRESGFIALTAGLAGGAESVLIPEAPFDIDEVCQRIVRGYQRGKLHSIIVVAEGAKSGFEVAKQIQEKTGFETRVIVLGHVQRGGPPTAFDRTLATRMGAKAVELLVSNQSGMMVGIRGTDIVGVDLEAVLQAKKEPDLSVFELATILAI